MSEWLVSCVCVYPEMCVRKQCMSGTVCARHCRLLFMKHVLPRLERPARPGSLCSACACSAWMGSVLHECERCMSDKDTHEKTVHEWHYVRETPQAAFHEAGVAQLGETGLDLCAQPVRGQCTDGVPF